MNTTFRRGDIIKGAASKQATWRVKAICFDGTLLVEPEIIAKHGCKDGWRIITRPRQFHKVKESSVGGTSGDCNGL